MNRVPFGTDLTVTRDRLFESPKALSGSALAAYPIIGASHRILSRNAGPVGEPSGARNWQMRTRCEPDFASSATDAIPAEYSGSLGCVPTSSHTSARGAVSSTTQRCRIGAVVR